MAKLLSPKQRSAIERANNNPSLQRILFSKAEGVVWFHAFKDAGFLEPHDIPRPIPTKDEGYVSIPVWPITEYLVTASSQLAEAENEPYAAEFLNFIRAATKYAKSANFGNYRVWWQFSKIISKIPPHLIEQIDLENIDYWLDDKYERGIVAESLGEHWLLTLLDKEESHSKYIAKELISIIFKIKTSEAPQQTQSKHSVTLRPDTWHAQSIVKKVATKVGMALGLDAVCIFKTRLEQTLELAANDKWSCIWRPAIEDHEQNMSTNETADVFVEAFRDTLHSYALTQPKAAVDFLNKLLVSPFDTTRRIAIYIADKGFADLRETFSKVLVQKHFRSNFRHELWNFLHNHYPAFTISERELALREIEKISERDDGEIENIGATAYSKTIWLLAIRDYDQNAGSLYKRYRLLLDSDPKHPEFSSYISAGFVDHQSPIPKDELLSLSIEALVDRLARFQDKEKFGEPGLQGLAKALRQIIIAEPSRFYKELLHFSRLDLAYVHEILEAFNQLWSEKAPLPWDDVWENLLKFCEAIVTDDTFWNEVNAKTRTAFVANRYWVVSAIGRLLENGSRSDEHAFNANFIPQATKVLAILLAREKGEPFSIESDAVSLAINSPRGRGIEAMINVALRACRVASDRDGEHGTTWMQFQQYFDKELLRPDAGEFEFATLVVNYLQNFLFMSKNWTLSNLNKMFDQENYQKWLCAMQGYAYVGTVYVEIYKQLKDGGHFLKALNDDNIKERTSEKIIQNIAVAYINDFEKLTDPNSLIAELISRKREDELGQLTWFLWTLRKSDDTRIPTKVFALWPLILRAADTSTIGGKRIAAKLCDWTAFVSEINEITKPLVLAVIPFVNEGHHSFEMLECIGRISATQPREAYEIWSHLLETSQPNYPPEVINKALGNLISLGTDGVRMAKQIASIYLRSGILEPHSFLREKLPEQVDHWDN